MRSSISSTNKNDRVSHAIERSAEIVASFDLDETLVVDRRLERTVALAERETLATFGGIAFDRGGDRCDRCVLRERPRRRS